VPATLIPELFSTHVDLVVATRQKFSPGSLVCFHRQVTGEAGWIGLVVKCNNKFFGPMTVMWSTR
jgi:hypothetical protein